MSTYTSGLNEVKSSQTHTVCNATYQTNHHPSLFLLSSFCSSFSFSSFIFIISGSEKKETNSSLTGEENEEELEALADDVYQYFGLGCRNVTKLLVPRGYNFEPLLNSFRKYNFLFDYQKYKNNYDYNLAVHLLNSRYYMSNGSLILVEDASPFSPVAQLHYEFYDDLAKAKDSVEGNDAIQCTVGREGVPFGGAQKPGICDYADSVDTIQFLQDLTEVRKA